MHFAEQIQYKSIRVRRLGMFEVHCDELIRTLVKRADAIVARLLARMLKDHYESNKTYVQLHIIVLIFCLNVCSLYD